MHTEWIPYCNKRINRSSM